MLNSKVVGLTHSEFVQTTALSSLKEVPWNSLCMDQLFYLCMLWATLVTS